MLRDTTACTFSKLDIWAFKRVRTPSLLYILTSKCASSHNGVHFFETRHLSLQKWSEPLVFCTIWLPYVLLATTACTFSSLISPDGSAPAALASLLFDPPEPQISGKTRESRLSYLFAHLHLLSSDSFSSDLLSSNLSLLSASALHCFSSVHIVGSLTSKLPSMITYPLSQFRLGYQVWKKFMPVSSKFGTANLWCTPRYWKAKSWKIYQPKLSKDPISPISGLEATHLGGRILQCNISSKEPLMQISDPKSSEIVDIQNCCVQQGVKPCEVYGLP